MEKLIVVLKTFGPGRLAAMGAVTFALIGFFAFILFKMSQPQMGVLFSGLTLEDTAAITKDLDSKGVTYELRGDGATILVPKDMITRVRMQLAEKKLPISGGVGYEIFDKSDTFSATSFVQGVNHLRALEGELARTIKSINRVEFARVHLVMPEKVLFARNKEEPSASIVLKIRGDLEPQQVRAIRHLVASAVQGLNPQKISIVDEGGRLLADGAKEGVGGFDGYEDRKLAHEQRLRKQIQDIVESVVGKERARVQVNAELDFNRMQQTQELFDPESKVVRSTQTREENSATSSRDGGVSVGNDLPGNTGDQGQQGGKDTNKKSEETVNYEISRTTKTEVIEGGRIKRVSVAVLVDGLYTTTPDGKMTYAPRAQEELDRISTLVRSAMGYDKNRGDIVEVVNLKFAESPLAAPSAEAPKGFMDKFQFGPTDIVSMIEKGVLLVLSLLVLLFVMRPLVRRVISQEGGNISMSMGGGSQNMNENGANQAGGTQVQYVQTQQPNGQIITQQSNLVNAMHASSQTQDMISQAQVTGEAHQMAIKHVGELVERNPGETATIIRKWIKEAA